MAPSTRVREEPPPAPALPAGASPTSGGVGRHPRRCGTQRCAHAGHPRRRGTHRRTRGTPDAAGHRGAAGTPDAAGHRGARTRGTPDAAGHRGARTWGTPDAAGHTGAAGTLRSLCSACPTRIRPLSSSATSL